MALSDTELRDLLQYLRQKIQQAGLGDLDQRIMSNFQASQSAYRDLEYYFKSLISVARFSSSEHYVETMRRFREYVRTEGGQPVSGIEVELTPSEREQFGVERIDLSRSPAMTQLIADLDSIMHQIRTERDNPDISTRDR